MLNGKKYAEEKPLFMFGAVSNADQAGASDKLEAHNKTLNIEDPERCKETIQVS